MILTIDNLWPVTLPLPRTDFSGTDTNSTFSSSVETGVIGLRSRFTPIYPLLQVEWVLEPGQYLDFLDFYRMDLGMGAGAFEIALRYPKNSQLTDWMVRFVGERNETKMETGLFLVKASIELIHPKNF